jgi:hypothetical protein
MQHQKLNKNQKFVFKLQSRSGTNNNGKCKGIPVLAWTDPWGLRSLRISDFKTIGS